MEIYKGMLSSDYTSAEQNEDIPFEIVLETILFGRNRSRLEKLIKKFSITDEELAELKHRPMSIEEYNSNASGWSN